MQIIYKNLVSALTKVLYDKDCLYRKEVEDVFNLNEEDVYYLMGNFALYLLKAEKDVINSDKMWLINGTSVVSVAGASLNSVTLNGAESRHARIESINRREEERILSDFIDFLEAYKFSKFSWSDFSRMRRLLNRGRRVFPFFESSDVGFQHSIVRRVFSSSDHNADTIANLFAMEMMKRKLDKVIKFRNDNIGVKVEYRIEKRGERFNLYRCVSESGWLESFTPYQLGDVLHSSGLQ